MHDTLRVRKLLQDFAMDEALAIALRRIWIYRRRVGNPVRDEIVPRLYERWRTGVLGCYQVLFFVHRMANGNVAEGIDKVVLV
jgi:hypothetical protein